MESVQSIDRAFQILTEVADEPAGISELSRRLDLPTSTVARLLGTLEQRLTRSGVYRGHRGEVDARGRVHCGSRHDEAIREAAAAVANEAAALGFHGPCGVDSFSYSMPDMQNAMGKLDF